MSTANDTIKIQGFNLQAPLVRVSNETKKPPRKKVKLDNEEPLMSERDYHRMINRKGRMKNYEIRACERVRKSFQSSENQKVI